MVQVKAMGDVLSSAKTLRIKFKKVGNLQYISHLDLVRTFHKMLIRVGMPLWYTEGFNPKPKMVFAFSMSVGLQSECEFLDVKINRELDTESVKEALNLTSTDELVIEEVYFPETKFTDIRYADYVIDLECEEYPENIEALVKDILSAKPLLINKFTKAGEKEVDISPLVDKVTVHEIKDGHLKIELTLYSENGNFLNPEYFLTLLKERAGILSGDLLKNRYTIMRKCAYDADRKAFL